jgi:8-amino-7-oxononanoate synthase
MDFDLHVRRRLSDLETAGLLRTPRSIEGPHGPTLRIAGREVIGLCSNNYLGLASDPRLDAAIQRGVEHSGSGAGASRQISGTSALHRAAESRLAGFVGAARALLFSTGYAANVGVIQALVGEGDVIFSDALNHASIIDGCRLSRARVLVYRHLDLEHLAALLAEQRSRFRAALVISETMFSMEGDLAPVAELRALSTRYGCGLMLDEAHALGVIGPQGRGLASRETIAADVTIGTLGKAFGCSGAFAAGTAELISLIENRARSFVYSTAPLPALAAAASAATDLVEAADERRSIVLDHARELRTGLRALGYRAGEGETPIIPIHIGSPEATMALSNALLDRGVFVHGIRPPTVPPGTSRLRVTPMATHTSAQIRAALDAFAFCSALK